MIIVVKYRSKQFFPNNDFKGRFVTELHCFLSCLHINSIDWRKCTCANDSISPALLLPHFHCILNWQELIWKGVESKNNFKVAEVVMKLARHFLSCQCNSFKSTDWKWNPRRKWKRWHDRVGHVAHDWMNEVRLLLTTFTTTSTNTLPVSDLLKIESATVYRCMSAYTCVCVYKHVYVCV